MLRQLRIENYALIDQLEVSFHGGLNLLTGETGSGKSIVVEAVGLLLGEKGSFDLIRTGSDRARIVGIFGPDAPAPDRTRKPDTGSRSKSAKNSPSAPSGTWSELRELLDESGIDLSDDEELILQRDFLAGGRTRVFINNQPATVGLLKSLASCLAEVHGQNEQQKLFEPSIQLDALDRFGGLSEQLASVRERFARWKEYCRSLEKLRAENEEWTRQRDRWEFEKREIERAALAAGEDERLEEEKRILSHAERIQARMGSSYELLYDAPNSAVASLGSARRSLDDVADFDPSLQPLADSLQEAQATIEDLSLTLRDRLANLEASPARLEEVANRLALLDRLKRKYAASLGEIIEYGKQLHQRVDQLESGEEEIRNLEGEQQAAAEAYLKAAKTLSSKRAKAAKELQRAVEKELAELAMSGTKFEVRLTAAQEESGWRADGIDEVEFLLSPNPGEPLRPLARIASGGETSRIMLALETVVACKPETEVSQPSSAPVLIFDEVDAGIGGRAAETVGRKLRNLGQRHQVLCVTHLPQIASFAHQHYRVEKTVENGRTLTGITQLSDDERKAEIARMLSGSRISPTGMEHAAQMLKANTR